MTEWVKEENKNLIEPKLYNGDYMSIYLASRAFNHNNHVHGFYDEERSVDRALMLIVGEVTEAHEEIRSGHSPTEVYFNKDSDKPDKPEGFPMEIADVIIRALDTAFELGIDIGSAIKQKHEYNKTRPYKHGRQF